MPPASRISNVGKCKVACPEGISMTNIARMNREYEKAFFAK